MKEHIKTGTALLLIAFALVLAFFALRKIAPFLIILLVALVFTTGIDPLVQRIRASIARWWDMPRSLATILVLLLGLVVLFSVIGFLVFTAVNEAILFAQNTWPHLQPRLLRWASDLSNHYTFIPSPSALLDTLRDRSGQIAQYLWNTTVYFFGALGAVFSLVTILILTFFFTTYKDGITYTMLQLVPVQYQSQVRTIGHDAAQRMGGWLRGQLILALIITVTVSAAMWLLGIPYPVLIGIIGGIGELVPMVGPYVAFFPAIAIALFIGADLWRLIAVVLFFIALTQTENYVLAPKIMERQVGLHPVTTILALFIGGSLLGIVGALLAIPVTAALRIIMIEAVFPAIQNKSARQIEAQRPQQSTRQKRRRNK